MNEATKAILLEIGKDNPGGLEVAIGIMEYLKELAAFDFALLKQQNILGVDLYYLYNDCCGRDVGNLHAAIMQRTGPEMLKSVIGSSFYRALEE